MHPAVSRTTLLAGFMLGAFDAALAQQQQQPQPRHVAVNASELRWVAGPPSLPPGARMAVVEGNPTQSGPFTIRLRFPANYRVGPHTHPSTERLTVLSGTLVVGTGQQSTRNGKALTAGGYAVMPAGLVHWASARGETVIQLSAMGPFSIRYVNAADDPQRRTPRD